MSGTPFFGPNPPQDEKGLTQWAASLLTRLNEVFTTIEPQDRPGTVLLWVDGIEVPDIYLPLDGTEYLRSVSPALYKLFGESTPGNFEVPNVAGPSGLIYVVRV